MVQSKKSSIPTIHASPMQILESVKEKAGHVKHIAAEKLKETAGSIKHSAETIKHKTRRRSIQVEDVEEALRSLKDEEKFLIRPDEPFLQNWDLCVFLALIFTAIVTPFEVAFVETELGPLFFVNRCVDLLFITDIVLQFLLMYPAENGRLVKSHKLIRRRYFRGWFAIDFITVLPFDMAKWVMDSSQVKIIRIIRLMRLLKLLRIVRASRIFTRWETKLGIDHGSMMYIKLVLTLSALTHWFACIWGLFAFIEAPEEYTWMSLWLDNAHAVFGNVESECTTNHNAFLNGAFREGCFTQSKLYIACIQLAVMTITGSGPGANIMPVNTAENLVIAILTLLSGIQWANIIGQICGIAASGDPVQHRFYQIGDDLNRLMRENHIDKNLRQHIRLYLRHSKTAMREQARKSILTHLSPELSGTMAMKGQRWISSSMVFWVNACSPTFLSLLIIKMGCQSFAPKEIIPANDSMFILKKGTCMTTRLIMKSSSNTCWNADFVFTSPSMEAIKTMVAGRTLSFVEVDVLSLDTFTELLAAGFPETPILQKRVRLWKLIRIVQYGAKKVHRGDFEQSSSALLRKASGDAVHGVRAVPGPSVGGLLAGPTVDMLLQAEESESAALTYSLFAESQKGIVQKIEAMQAALAQLASAETNSDKVEKISPES